MKKAASQSLSALAVLTLFSAVVGCQADYAAPSLVKFDGTGEVKISKSTQTLLKGISDPESRVKIYADSLCEGKIVGEGDAEQFESEGITATAEPNVITNFFAIAVGANGVASGCSESRVAYIADTQAPPAPVFTSARYWIDENPNDYRLDGETERDSQVDIYTAADCAGDRVATTRSDILDKDNNYTANGVAVFFAVVAIDPGTTKTFYARAMDRAGNVSACSPMGYPVSP